MNMKLSNVMQTFLTRVADTLDKGWYVGASGTNPTEAALIRRGLVRTERSDASQTETLALTDLGRKWLANSGEQECASSRMQ